MTGFVIVCRQTLRKRYSTHCTMIKLKFLFDKGAMMCVFPTSGIFFKIMMVMAAGHTYTDLK